MAVKGMAEFRANGEDFTLNDPNIADEFNTSTNYAENDFAYYQGNLYRFTQSHSGAWNNSHVVLVKLAKYVDTRIAGEVETLDDRITQEVGVLNEKIDTKADVHTGWVVPDIITRNENRVYHGTVGNTIYATTIDGGNSCIIDVTGLSKIKVTGYSWDSINYTYALCIFTTGSYNVISKYTEFGHFRDLELSVPADAKYAYINGSGDGKYKADVRIQGTAKKIDGIIRDSDFISRRVDGVDCWSVPDNILRYENRVYRGTVNELIGAFTIDGGDSCVLDVTGISKVKVTGFSWDLSYGYSLYIFTNNNYRVLSKFTYFGRYSDYEVDVPSNAKYLYVSGIHVGSGGERNEKYRSNIKTYRLANEFDEIAKANSFLSGKVDGFKTWSVAENIIQENDILHTGSVGATIGTNSYSGGKSCMFDVTGFSQVKVTGYSWDTRYNYRLAFFTDSSRVILSRYEDSGRYKDVLMDVPSGAKYLYVNGEPGQYAPSVKTFTVETDFSKLLEAVGETREFYSKNLLLLGDSITQLGMGSRGWPFYMNETIKANRIDNIAVIGAHWKDYNDHTEYNGNPTSDGGEQNVIGNQVQKIINNRADYLEDYDYIFIAAGTNDGVSTGILTNEEIDAQYFDDGTIKDLSDVDRSTWAGATRYAVEKLQELFPTAQIVFNTPIHRVAGYSGAGIMNNSKVIIDCARAASVKVCDVTYCGVRMTDEDSFVDGLHPSAKGAKLMGDFIAKWFINDCHKLDS